MTSTGANAVVDDLREIVPKIMRGLCHRCMVHVISFLMLTATLAALAILVKPDRELHFRPL